MSTTVGKSQPFNLPSFRAQPPPTQSPVWNLRLPQGLARSCTSPASTVSGVNHRDFAVKNAADTRVNKSDVGTCPCAEPSPNPSRNPPLKPPRNPLWNLPQQLPGTPAPEQSLRPRQKPEPAPEPAQEPAPARSPEPQHAHLWGLDIRSKHGAVQHC